MDSFGIAWTSRTVGRSPLLFFPAALSTLGILVAIETIVGVCC